MDLSLKCREVNRCNLVKMICYQWECYRLINHYHLLIKGTLKEMKTLEKGSISYFRQPIGTAPISGLSLSSIKAWRPAPVKSPATLMKQDRVWLNSYFEIVTLFEITILRLSSFLSRLCFPGIRSWEITWSSMADGVKDVCLRWVFQNF